MAHDHAHEGHQHKPMSTWQYLKNKIGKKKPEIEDFRTYSPPPPPTDVMVATLAVVLDGEVQEVLRAQDRLAALLMSNPEFIDVSDELLTPTIGWSYVDGKFHAPEGDGA